MALSRQATSWLMVRVTMAAVTPPMVRASEPPVEAE